MKLNEVIISILRDLNNLKNENIMKYLLAENGIVTIKIDGSKLVEITADEIILNGENLEEKILCENKDKIPTKIHNFTPFLKEISHSITRLNHIGISYFCENIDKEIGTYEKILENSNFKIYEGESGKARSRWFFIGDKNDWNSPLFEIVLNENNGTLVDEWKPHFQVHIDTKFTIDEIENLTRKYFGHDFFKWKLDTPGYGIVCAMGFLGEIGCSKICLGIGFRNGSTEEYRKNGLKELQSSRPKFNT